MPGSFQAIEDAPTQPEAVAVTEFKRVYLERRARFQKAGNITRADDQTRQRWHAGNAAQMRSQEVGYDDLTVDEQAAVDTLFGTLGAAFLMAMADGHLSDEEYDALVTFLIEFSDGELSEEAIEDGLEEWEAIWEQEGQDVCFEQMRDCLVEHDARLSALEAAAAIALADGTVAPEEHRMYDAIARVLGINNREAQGVFSTVEQMFSQ